MNPFKLALTTALLSSAAAQLVCENAPSCLRNNAQVEGICSGATVTSTHITSTTIIGWVTSRTSQNAVSQVTVDITSIFTMPTVTQIQSTVTSVAYQTGVCSPQKRNPQDGTPCDNGAVQYLANFEPSSLAAVCACLDYPVATTTTTSIATLVSPATTLIVDGVPSTTTRYFLSNQVSTRTVLQIQTKVVTSNVCAATEVASTPTQTPTPNAVASSSTPTPTQVLGPWTGCSDVGSTSNFQLNDTIHDLPNALKACASACSQNGQCRHVYVQERYPESEGRSCTFQCYLHDQAFNQTNALNCSAQNPSLGSAVALDMS